MPSPMAKLLTRSQPFGSASGNHRGRRKASAAMIAANSAHRTAAKPTGVNVS